MTYFLLVAKGPAVDPTDAPQPWGLLCNPDEDDDDYFLSFS
jgi:hypothetical protein